VKPIHSFSFPLTAARAWLVAACLAVSGLAAQTWEPGSTHYGPTGRTWIEFRVGTMPLILSVPHGGSTTTSLIPNRTWGTTTTDSFTRELAQAISDEIFARSGQRPHMVICNLARTKLDANREIVEAAQGNSYAEAAWESYHGFMRIARQEVTRNHGSGFMVDVHGHGHEILRLELGYTLSTSEINASDSLLDLTDYIRKSSVRTLAFGSPLSHSQLLRGPSAFGTLIANEGVPAVPSQQDPSPGSDPYFAGGYITDTHTSVSDAGMICGFQLESHRIGVRDTVANRAAFAIRFANAMHDYFGIHYGVDLGLRPQVRLEWVSNRVREGNTARLRLHRAGDRRAALTATLQLSGTATAGADYTAPAGTVNLPAGAEFVDVTIPLLTDALAEGTETLVAGLLLPAGARLLGPTTATLYVEDANTAQVWVEAVEPVVTAGGQARFRVRRSDTSGSLTVGLAAGGTARPGWDHADGWPPATVTFATGQGTVELTTATPAESRLRADRTLSLTVAAGPNHRVGLPGTATATLVTPIAATTGPIFHLGGQAADQSAKDLARPSRRINPIPDVATGPQPGGTTRQPHWSFDGASSILYVPPFAAAPEGTFSVSVRFRLPAVSGSASRSLFSWGPFDQTESVHVYILDNNRQLRTVFSDDPGQATSAILDAGNTFADNQWHHYALVVTPGQPARVYVDGVQRATLNRGGLPMATPQFMWIGWREGSTGNRFWTGQVADLRWYHRALSATEVQDLAADRPGWSGWAQDRGLNPALTPGATDALGQPLHALYALGGEPNQPSMLPRAGVGTNGEPVFRWLERADLSGLQVTPERLLPGGFGPPGPGFTESQQTIEMRGETWRERTLTGPPGTPADSLRLRVQTP